MAEFVPSEFCRWELSQQEQKAGAILTTENIYVIQNMIAQCALDKIELAASRKNYDEYWQREAELQGEIRVLKSLLDNHRNVIENLEFEEVRHDTRKMATPAQIFSAEDSSPI